jgi:hypothetical protein
VTRVVARTWAVTQGRLGDVAAFRGVCASLRIGAVGVVVRQPRARERSGVHAHELGSSAADCPWLLAFGVDVAGGGGTF